MTPIKCIALCLLLFLAFSSFAQNNKYDIGLEGGPSLMYMYGNTVIVKNNPWISVSTGAAFQYNVPKIFLKRLTLSVKTGLYYDRKGDEKTFSSINPSGIQETNVKLHLNLNYLTVPVLAKASILAGKGVKVFVDAGPYLSVLINAQASFSNGEPNTINTSNFKRVDSGVQAGIGCTIPIGRQFEISVEDRNSIGLLNISSLPVINNGTIKTFSSALLFGFNYKFGKAKIDSKS